MELSIRKSSVGQDDRTWLGTAHGTQSTTSITLDLTTFDRATHAPEGWLKSGLPLMILREENGQDIYGLFVNGAAAPGNTLEGYLFATVEAPAGATLLGGALYWHGRVITAKLPVAVDAAGQATLTSIKHA